MRLRMAKVHIGLRTTKTAAAVVISMMLVSAYGVSPSKLIFSMLGAMAAMEHTFRESLESCLSQIIGVIFGTLAGILLLALPFPELLDAGIGVVLVITFYNVLRIRYSPALPCLIVATICTTPDLQPVTYAITRFWDTMLGIGVGMAINTLVFPYDNSSRLNVIAECLDKEVIRFLEDMFDGDEHLPDTGAMSEMIEDMARQLLIFSKQSMLLYRRKNQEKLEAFRVFEGKSRQMAAQMEVLSRMEYPGRLNQESRIRLKQCGAQIRDARALDAEQELDIVTNYHVGQILTLRQELTEILKG